MPALIKFSRIAISKSIEESLKLHKSLVQFGFAKIKIDDQGLADGLESALDEAQKLSTFRFPPIDEGSIVYNDASRRAFQSLFQIALPIYNLLSGHDHDCPAPLFSPDRNQPLQPDVMFSQSFFNIFNYNHGCLNPHIDRSLVTVISSRVPSSEQPKDMPTSRLWIQNQRGDWQDIDATLSPGEVIVMVGEDFVTDCSDTNLYAALHAVKVDPNGENVPRAHFQRDPQSSPVGNRVSAALILRK